MSPNRQSRLPLRAALLLIMVVPPISILAALSWLKHMPEGLVFLVCGIASVMTVAASFTLAVLHDRGIDEWTRTNARFSSQWGWTAGASLLALCLALPPFRSLIISTVATWLHTSNPDQTLVLVTFTFGFMAVVFAQLICTALLSMAWAFWKSRPAHDPA